jgi:hypothetical protein
MIRYPKLQNMMTKLPRPAGMGGVGAPVMPGAGARALAAPAPRMAPMPTQALPTAAMPHTQMTLPSIQATQNQAMPIELGDPQRLAKIATLLRMGRK